MNRILEHMLLWSSSLFAQSLGAMASMMQEMQRLTVDGIDQFRLSSNTALDVEGRPPFAQLWGYPTMQDKNLNDDMVKLIQWTVLSVKPDAEKKVIAGEKVTDINTSSEGFTAVVLNQPAVQKALTAENLTGSDAKYVRIFYTVLERWPKVDAEYPKKQVEVLQEISNKIG